MGGDTGIICESNGTISGNIISYCGFGIYADGCPLITNNLIINCDCGINTITGAVIEHNAIARNRVGIEQRTEASPTFVVSNNNLENNTYNYYLDGQGFNVNAANNWWGTTETSVIDRLIHDFNDDFNLGKVNYIPILTAPNSEAPTIPADTSNPTPTQPSQPSNSSGSSSQNSTSTQDQSSNTSAPETNVGIAVAAIIFITAIMLFAVGMIILHRKNR